MRFEWKVTFGDLLTFVSILVSAAGLAWTWHQDVLTRERDQATEVRKAAAATLAKLERLGQLNDLLFADLQPTIVEAADLLAEKHSAEAARDYFWKTVSGARLSQRKREMDEQIESAYVTLYSYMTEARPMFKTAVESLRSAEDEAVDAILIGSQAEFLDYDASTYKANILGNKCRSIVSAQRKAYFAKAASILAPLERRLEQIISRGDDAIMEALNTKAL
jgi:hypothetical protein